MTEQTLQTLSLKDLDDCYKNMNTSEVKLESREDKINQILYEEEIIIKQIKTC